MKEKIKEKIKKIKKQLLNNKSILSNAIITFIIKGASIIVALFTMPAYMRYFEEQKVLGLWFTILSVLSWILTFDLGIGNGLRNNLVIALGNNDKVKAKKYVSSSYIVTMIIVLIAYLISYTIFPMINWNEIFNIEREIISETLLIKTIQIIFNGIMLQFLLKIITSIIYALQKSFIPSLLNLITTLVQLLYVLMVPGTDLESNLINLAYVHILAVNIPLIVTTIIVFMTKLKDSRPNIKFFDKKIAKDVMKLGGAFFWVQIMYMILTATNEYLISYFFSPDKVVEYQIYNKLFILIGTFFNLALTPIWSAVTKAFSEKNIEWIRKLYVFLKKLALLGVICEFIFIAVIQFVVNIWLGEEAIIINYADAFIFALFGSIFIINSVLSSIANGLGELKIQLIAFTVGSIAKVLIISILKIYYNDWIIVMLSTVLVMIPFCIVQERSLTKYLKRCKETSIKE